MMENNTIQANEIQTDAFIRTQALLGMDAMQCLEEAHIIIFGIGGVGGYVVEALARSGVGKFTLVDHDKIAKSNMNRQIIATHETIGQYKVDVMKQRILQINPHAIVNTKKCFFLPDTKDEFQFHEYDYIIDAIDTVSAKIELVLDAREANVPIISCMGTGNKLDPSKFKIDDLYKTSVCPLARVMRQELRKRGVLKLDVLYSQELPVKGLQIDENSSKRAIPASIAFVPSVAGLMMAGYVIKKIVGIEQ